MGRYSFAERNFSFFLFNASYGFEILSYGGIVVFRGIVASSIRGYFGCPHLRGRYDHVP